MGKPAAATAPMWRQTSSSDTTRCHAREVTGSWNSVVARSYVGHPDTTEAPTTRAGR